MIQTLVFLSGLVFGLGLILSGMTNPSNVIDFLDLAGAWNPSLAFVMLGAIPVAWIGFHFTEKRQQTFFNTDLEMPSTQGINTKLILGSILFGAGWYKIYDLLEFMVTLHNFDKGMFKYRCNDILQKEGSGYRFVGEEIVPIVDEIELQAIEQAIDCCSKHQFDGARKHFDSALEKLSDRPKPDYRNSIKESISAVESVCVIISGERNFERALKKLKDSIGLHPALEKGMSSIYGYTSDADGIRHAMIEESDCDLADAKYMLVSCSAFINYLIMKAGKAGLLK